MCLFGRPARSQRFVMRLIPAATWMAALFHATTPALAQLTPPAAIAKPKPVATVPVRPAVQAPQETGSAMTLAERLSLQSDIAWIGQYNGAINGDASCRMVNAIKAYQ